MTRVKPPKTSKMTNGSTLTATMLKSLSRDKEDSKVRVAKWLRSNDTSNPEALFKAMDDIVSDFKEVEKQVQSEVKFQLSDLIMLKNK